MIAGVEEAFRVGEGDVRIKVGGQHTVGQRRDEREAAEKGSVGHLLEGRKAGAAADEVEVEAFTNEAVNRVGEARDFQDAKNGVHEVVIERLERVTHEALRRRA